ncbi:Hsp20/alpha crystallin family protein [Haloferax mediterranei ATCC 33500]|uniref:Hsp20 type chaperone n=1 Tax=Haloferax mediterranei (strain ATCC 33500 / DSM 1411 / JCM 8866 / NBRC 14739 / NCIMB 2177 / R-4) TaxID=523841 RepID=I3R1S3_HALMT|nr:Hsp20/alpha crystallin family protein [Haloferax mediterranei]AFK18183.1 hsp20 type chaperone [Haloferax mediterranei ATCC 33500]AHZ22409.1 type III effector protein [Haloferax mediterranei ATCC 33500]EMA02543.1 hsp20 type chaperone [Haloferax mediterranei ATCC 33500]MDX5988274.1 Hsp20/alpha crystallin family protein [Haloferax mediterranei ATCC 33500]QCQ74712.1 Hsp20/alpha crystallin family protein [Haloferax mediterranei ATCC 33500]
MVRDDRDDPFDNIFDEIERMMNDMTGGDAGFASETHIDVYDEGTSLRLVADLPGVDKDAIDLKCDGETLTISAAGDRREYDERVRLPARVDEHSASATFNNGVLQVTFDRAEDSAAIDVE